MKGGDTIRAEAAVASVGHRWGGGGQGESQAIGCWRGCGSRGIKSSQGRTETERYGRLRWMVCLDCYRWAAERQWTETALQGLDKEIGILLGLKRRSCAIPAQTLRAPQYQTPWREDRINANTAFVPNNKALHWSGNYKRMGANDYRRDRNRREEHLKLPRSNQKLRQAKDVAIFSSRSAFPSFRLEPVQSFELYNLFTLTLICPVTFVRARHTTLLWYLSTVLRVQWVSQRYWILKQKWYYELCSNIFSSFVYWALPPWIYTLYGTAKHTTLFLVCCSKDILTIQSLKDISVVQSEGGWWNTVALFKIKPIV